MEAVILDSPRPAPCNHHKGPYEREKDNVPMEAERGGRCSATGFETGGRDLSQGRQVPLCAGKCKGANSSRKPPNDVRPGLGFQPGPLES